MSAPASAATSAPGSSGTTGTPTPDTSITPGAAAVYTTTPPGQTPSSDARVLTDAAGAPCVLYPSQVHARKSGNYGTMGNKPYTKCDVPVLKIHQDTTMYKTVLVVGWKSQGIFSGGNSQQSSYTQKNVAVTCTNSKSTTWYAVVKGTIEYGGTTYYSTVQTANDKENCGT